MGAPSDRSGEDAPTVPTQSSVECRSPDRQNSPQSLVGVRLRETGRLVYAAPMREASRPPGAGDWVLVELGGWRDAGRVVLPPSAAHTGDMPQPLPTMLRFLTPVDLETMRELDLAADEARTASQELVAALGLALRVVHVHVSYDGRRLTAFYAAEGEVDVGQLAHRLTAHFGRQVELRPTGGADMIAAVGGLGRSRLWPCCTTWLPAEQRSYERGGAGEQGSEREQEHPSSDASTPRLCRRLLRCLADEQGQHGALRSTMPRLNTPVMTAQGLGRVMRVQVLRQLATVYVPATDASLEVPLAALQPAAAEAEPPDHA